MQSFKSFIRCHPIELIMGNHSIQNMNEASKITGYGYGKPYIPRNFKLNQDHRDQHQKLLTLHDPSQLEHHEAKALHDYSASSWPLNKALIHQSAEVEKFHQRLRDTDAAISKFKMPHDMHVYTGVGHVHPLSLEPGIKHVEHAGYTSTTLSRETAEHFGTEHWDATGNKVSAHALRIRVPAGHSGVYMYKHSLNPQEHELLLPRGLRLKIHPKPEIRKEAVKNLHGNATEVHHHMWDAEIA